MFVQRFKSSITLQLVCVFLGVMSLTLVSLSLTLRALHQTQTAQQHLTQTTMPLLLLSQRFSRSLFEYLTLTEKASLEQSVFPEFLVIQIDFRKQALTDYFDELQRLGGASDDITQIIEASTQIITTAEGLISSELVQRNQLIASIDECRDQITQLFAKMRALLQRYQMLHASATEAPEQISLTISKELIALEEVLSQRFTQMTPEQIQSLEVRHRSSMRQITQYLLQVHRPEIKASLAQLTTQVFEQLFSSQGLFVNAQALLVAESSIAQSMQRNQRQQQIVNRLLQNFIQDVTETVNDKMSLFERSVMNSIFLSIAIMITLIFATLAIVYGFIVPKITQRLNRLAKDTRLISEHHYETVIDVSGTDQIAQMAHALEGFKQALIIQQKNEQEREQLLNKLMMSNQELQRFAFVCSHDLQEPFRMIYSYTDKLSHYLLDTRVANDPKVTKYLHFIHDGADRALKLIRDVLAYSSIHTQTQRFVAIDCQALIETICQNLGLDDSHQRVTVEALPVIQADQTQLFQLFQNLISNAFKYQIDNHCAQVHIGVTELEDHWRFYVQDNGIGMDSKNLDKIFELFQRLNRKSEYPGKGVGLAICKRVVERHGGNIWAESEQGVGSTFYFTLQKNLDEGVKHV